MEIRCCHCDAILRVSEEHVDRHTRCPVCETVQRVAGVPREPPGLHDSVYGDLPSPSGQTPVIAGAEDTGDESPAASGAPLTPDQSSSSPPSPVSTGQTMESAATQADIRAEFRQAHQRKHRSMLILVLAVVGLGCTCPVLSILAWVMSSNDLRAMNAGEVDPAGREATRVGYFLGMGASLLWITVAFLITVGMLMQPGG